MLKWIFNLALFYLLYRLAKGLFTPGDAAVEDQRAQAKTEDGAAELVEDPHCHTYIPKADAVTDRKGRHFCSRACLEAYQRAEG